MDGEDARREFYEQQLFEAKSALFSASTVREIKFLQNKIKFLEQRMNGKTKQK